jgi:methyl-accepting chemotaxis protein
MWDILEKKVFQNSLPKALATVWLLCAMQSVITFVVIVIMLRAKRLAGTSWEGAVSTLNTGMVVAAVTAVIFIVSTFILVRGLRYLCVKPLAQMDALFEKLGNGQSDLSEEMHELPYPELKHVAGGYNTFMHGIRDIIDQVRHLGIRIAIDSTRVRRGVAATAEKTRDQKALSEMVAHSSNDADLAIGEVAENAQYASEKTGRNLGMAKEAFGELSVATRKVEEINQMVGNFRDTVAELNKNTAGIMEIVGLIKNISEQTNLLSLNATIEAARAGEHGKGFAVVAEEVRILAKQVKTATEDISARVEKMVVTVEKTKAETDGIQGHSSEVGQSVTQTADQFEAMIADFEGINDQLHKIAAAIEELSLNNKEVNQKVQSIDGLTQEINAAMCEAETKVCDLNTITEKLQEMVAPYKTGNGGIDAIFAQAHAYRDQIQSQIAKMMSKGIDVFDRNHKPVAGTSPQKYTTAFTEAFAKTFQAFCDGILTQVPGAVYALPIDDKGYLATHHAKVAQPMTGNYEVDALNSRHMRIFFSLESEKRRATNRTPMLLQTYMRDTGETLNELSLPIVVNKRHWGAFILGLNPDHFLQEAA